MNIKVLGLFGALAFAAPVTAIAAPAGGMTANSVATLTMAPHAATDAAVAPGDAPAKVEKIWWRRGYGWRGYGWRGYGYRGGYYGFRGPFVGYGHPYWHHRWGY